MFPPWALTSPQILYFKETLSNQGKCSCYNEHGVKARYTLRMYYSNFVFPKHIYADKKRLEVSQLLPLWLGPGTRDDFYFLLCVF